MPTEPRPKYSKPLPTTDSRRIDPRRIVPAPAISKVDHFALIPPTIQDQDVPRRDGLDVKRSQRADFRPELFTNVIVQKGRYVVWRKAMICPCVNPITDQAELNCPDCDSAGFVYIDPVRIQVWLTNFDQRLDIYKHAGSWLAGEGSATVLPEHRMGYRDSIELEDDVMPLNEVLVKGDRRGSRASLPENVDTARYRIQQIVRIAYKDSADKVRLAEQDVHYRLDAENGWIVWLPESRKILHPPKKSSDRGNPAGPWFSILYNFHPVYLVTSYGNANRSENNILGKPDNTIVGLPLRVLIKLHFLVNPNAPVTGSRGLPVSAIEPHR